MAAEPKEPTGVVVVATQTEPQGIPGSLKMAAAAFLLAGLAVLGYEAQSARAGGDPTITNIVRNRRLLKVAVSGAAGVVGVSMLFLVAHFGFGVAMLGLFFL